MQAWGGRGRAASGGGREAKTLEKAKLRRWRTEAHRTGVCRREAEHLLRRTKQEKMSLHFSMEYILDTKKKKNYCHLDTDDNNYLKRFTTLSYRCLTSWFSFLSLLDAIYIFRFIFLIKQINRTLLLELSFELHYMRYPEALWEHFGNDSVLVFFLMFAQSKLIKINFVKQKLLQQSAYWNDLHPAVYMSSTSFLFAYSFILTSLFSYLHPPHPFFFNHFPMGKQGRIFHVCIFAYLCSYKIHVVWLIWVILPSEARLCDFFTEQYVFSVPLSYYLSNQTGTCAAK